MGGISALNRGFLSGTADLHLNSPSGNYPLYAIETAKGELIGVEVGTWEQGEATLEEALFTAIPVPPIMDDTTLVAKPCILKIRNIKSPDAERFRKSEGVDLKEQNKLKNGRKTDRKAIVSDEKITKVSAASCIVDFVNVPDDNEDGDVYYLKANKETNLAFIEGYPVAIDQITLLVQDQKRFEKK